MSKSIKKAIIKDKGLRQYHKIIRRVQKQELNKSIKLEDLFLLEIPNPKNIINDYDYSDYRFNYEYKNYFKKENKNYINKLRRK